MCGIAVFLGRFDVPLLGRMRARIAHRGPDGEGQCLPACDRLGTKRLNRTGKADLAYPIFALMVLEEWCRTFIDDWTLLSDGPPPDPDRQNEPRMTKA